MSMGPKIKGLLAEMSKEGQIERGMYSKLLKMCKEEKNKDKQGMCKALLKDMRKRRRNVGYMTNKGLAIQRNMSQMAWFTPSCRLIWPMALEANLIPTSMPNFCDDVEPEW